jgi:hypothetical protein
MAREEYNICKGHSRILIGADGLPAALLWVMANNCLVHAPTKRKCCIAFLVFMDQKLRMGSICQLVKNSLPKSGAEVLWDAF